MADKYDDLLKYQKLYESEKARIDAMEAKSEEEKIKRSYAAQIASARNSVRAEKLKLDEIDRLQKLSNDRYLAALKERAKAEADNLAELKREIGECYDSIAKMAEENMESVIKNRDAMAKRLDNFGGAMTQSTVFGGGDDGEDITFKSLTDFSRINQMLQGYGDNISKIKERLASGKFSRENISDFLSVMASLSFEDGSAFSSLLLSASDNDFIGYVSGYLENQQQIRQIATALYEDDFNDGQEKTLNYMKESLSALGLEVPEDFTLSGTVSAENFGTAFKAELENQLDGIRNMISDFGARLYLSPSGNEEKSASPSVTYNQNFNVSSSKETAFEQISAWKRATLLAKLRG